MKNKSLLIIVTMTLCLLITSMQAQQYTPFPTSNAYWLEFYGWFEIGWDQKFYLSGDTIIGNEVYSKVYSKREHGINDTVGGDYTGGIREDTSKHVYFLPTQDPDVLPCLVDMNRELILYDFNVEIGDTLKYLIDTIYYPHLDTLLYVSHIVTDIDSVEVLGEFRKRFAIYTFEPMANYRYGYWIEGIGSTVGLFSPIQFENCGPGFFNTEFLCFFQNNMYVYSAPWNAAFCNAVGVDDELTEQEPLVIYPNPASNTLNIRYSILGTRYSVFIYDLYGRQMDEIIIPVGQEATSIDVSSYPGGIFLAIIKNEKGIIGRKKFMVMKP